MAVISIDIKKINQRIVGLFLYSRGACAHIPRFGVLILVCALGGESVVPVHDIHSRMLVLR